MNDTTTTAQFNPFQQAIEATQARKVARAAAEAAREAAKAARLEAAAEEGKRLKRRAQLGQNVQNCISNFFGAVANHAMVYGWSEGAILAAQDYCIGLVNQTGAETVELPNISREMKNVIHDIFVKRVTFFGEQLPAMAFYGQKQDWFTELVEEINKPKERSVKPQLPRVKIPKPGEVVPAPRKQDGDNVVELRPAITPPAKKVKKSEDSQKIG